MRNLTKYPITTDEKETFLHECYNKWTEEQEKNGWRCGDTTGAIIREILKDIHELNNINSRNLIET